MAKTWTVVRFEDENVVEAVPSNWIVNGGCYWPPYTTEKILKAIKDNVRFDSSWMRYEVYVFKNSTSESYQACRLKAKKVEDTSDLNSDCHKKRIIKKKRIYSDSSDSDYDNYTKLPSPPVLQEYSDTEIQTSKMYTTGKEKKRSGETYNDSSNNNVPGPSNINVYTSSIQQRYPQQGVNMHRYNASYSTSTDKQIFDDANLCTSCPKHKNYDEKFRRVFKELFLLREVTKECCEDLKVTFLQKYNADETNENESTFLSTFNFPLQRIEHLNEVEQYLEQPSHFHSTVKELSKMGGSTSYDFVKRYLSLLFSNSLAEQYSWYGAKKKQVFGKLFLASVLQVFNKLL